MIDTLQDGLKYITNKAGVLCRFKYYSQSIGSVWDDDVVLTQSGNSIWASGIVLPVNSQTGTKDYLLQQEGKLAPTDIRLFVSGNISFGGSTLQTKIQIGSPTGDEFGVIPLGILDYSLQNTSIFRKAYLRRITNGSLIGE